MVRSLSAQTYEQIKQLLIDYGLLRWNEGYVLIHDSLSAFYDTLCVRLNLDTASTSNSEAQLPEQGLLHRSHRQLALLHATTSSQFFFIIQVSSHYLI